MYVCSSLICIFSLLIKNNIHLNVEAKGIKNVHLTFQISNVKCPHSQLMKTHWRSKDLVYRYLPTKVEGNRRGEIINKSRWKAI